MFQVEGKHDEQAVALEVRGPLFEGRVALLQLRPQVLVGRPRLAVPFFEQALQAVHEEVWWQYTDVTLWAARGWRGSTWRAVRLRMAPDKHIPIGARHVKTLAHDPSTHFMMATRRLMRSEAVSMMLSSARLALSPSCSGTTAQVTQRVSIAHHSR